MGDCPDGRGRVAQGDLQRDLFGCKKRTVCAALGRSRSASTTRPSGRTSWGIFGRRGCQRAAERWCSRPPAHAVRYLPPGLPDLQARDRRRRTAQAHRRQPLVTEVQSAPATARGEWHLGDDAHCCDIGQPGVGDRLQGEIARGCAGRVPRERVRKDFLLRACGGYELQDPQRRLGECPGLVVADESTEASDSTASSRWAAATLGHLERGHCAVTLISKINPSGTRFTIPVSAFHARGGRPSWAITETVNPIASGTETREPQQQPIICSLEWGAGVTEGGAGWSVARHDCQDYRVRFEKCRALVPDPQTTRVPAGSPPAQIRRLRLDSSSASPSADRTPVSDNLIAGRQATTPPRQPGRSPRPDRLRRVPPSPPAQRAPRAGQARAWIGSPGVGRPRSWRSRSPERAHRATMREHRQHAEEQQYPVGDVARLRDDARVGERLDRWRGGARAPEESSSLELVSPVV